MYNQVLPMLKKFPNEVFLDVAPCRDTSLHVGSIVWAIYPGAHIGNMTDYL